MSVASTQSNEPSKSKLVTVHFRHIGELEKVDLKVDAGTTLQAAWDEAYRLLGVSREERDTLQSASGEGSINLMPYLGLTLDKLKEDHVVKNLQFEIAAETGGA